MEGDGIRARRGMEASIESSELEVLAFEFRLGVRDKYDSLLLVVV